MFFYLSELLFSGFLQFKLNFYETKITLKIVTEHLYELISLNNENKVTVQKCRVSSYLSCPNKFCSKLFSKILFKGSGAL